MICFQHLHYHGLKHTTKSIGSHVDVGWHEHDFLEYLPEYAVEWVSPLFLIRIQIVTRLCSSRDVHML